MFRTLLLIGALIPALVFAYTSPGKPAGAVNDFAGMLQVSERQALETKLDAFEKQTGNAIVVATIPNLGGDTVENYAVRLFEEWGIGQKGKDNGVLVLIARDDRRVRIEVGYGLEGSLTDAQSYWIIQGVITPAFRNGNYYAGLDGAADKIIAALGGEIIPSASAESAQSSNVNIDWFWLVLFAPIWLASILGRSKSWWAGGVLGGITGVIIGLVKGFLYTGVISIVLLIPLGLLFDFLVSRAYQKHRSSGRVPPWWLGGAGFGGRGGLGGGGFGGFGGGSSGGGGASSRW